MNFCSKCRFMLYTKRVKDELDESGEFILKNYCKNCSWEGDYTIPEGDKITVYKQNYTREFLTDTALLSQYTINDPTLPRVNNIKCVNKTCLTNLKLGDNVYYHCKNLTDEEYVNLKENIEEEIKLNQEEIIISLENQDDKKIEEYPVKITEFVKPQREIIFIKYDPVNLKYIYICSTCKTTWKND